MALKNKRHLKNINNDYRSRHNCVLLEIPQINYLRNELPFNLPVLETDKLIPKGTWREESVCCSVKASSLYQFEGKVVQTTSTLQVMALVSINFQITIWM